MTSCSLSHPGACDPGVETGPCTNGALEDCRDALSVALMLNCTK